MERYIRKLEKEQRDEVDERQMFTKETTTLSKRQAHERLVSLSIRARKALWFRKQYGLQLALTLCFKDTEGNQYPLKISLSRSTSPAPPTTLQQTPGSTLSTTSQAPGLLTPTPPQVPGSTHSTPTGTSGAAPSTPPQTPVAVPPANRSSCKATVTSLNGTPPLGNRTTTQC